jgi:hypothetical protein
VACRGMHPRLRMLAFLLGLLSMQFQPASAGDQVLRYSNNEAGNASPIIVHADSIITWMEGHHRVLLFKGHVLIDHGTITVRMDQGAASIDIQKLQTTNILHFDLFAEGEVKLEHGAVIQTGPSGIMQLNTRGELRLRSHVNKVLQQQQADDETYQRAMKIWSGQGKRATTGYTRVMAYQDPAPAPVFPPPGAQGGAAQQPAGAPVFPTPDAQAGTAQPPPAATSIFPPPGVQGSPTQPPPGSPAPAPVYPNQQTPAATGPAPVISAGPAVPGPGIPVTIPGGPAVVAPAPVHAPFRQFSLGPRTALDMEMRTVTTSTGDHLVLVTGGIILVVKSTDNKGLVDFEADRLIIWTKDDVPELMRKLRSPGGKTSNEFEIYLAGNVEIRQQDGKTPKTLRADEVYYDVARNVAVAMHAEMEFRDPRIPDPLLMRADQINQLNPDLFKGLKAQVSSSKTPADPGLTVNVSTATIEIIDQPRKNIFGIVFRDPKTGEPMTNRQQIFQGENMILRIEDWPIFYFPYVRGDVNNPLGPLQSFSFSQNRVFGAQFLTNWDIFNLLGISPSPTTRWRLDLDYMTKRGPAAGTTFDYASKDFFGLPSLTTEHVRAWGIHDTGTDILGGNRGENDNHPEWRGWFDWQQNVQALPHGFVFQSQLSALSDKNFLEQYFKNIFDNDVNQNTYAYLKQQQDNWAWTLFAEARIRNWVNETNYLPRADGYLIGQSFFDLLTYNVQGSAAYTQMKPTNIPPPPFSATTQKDDTGRLDLWQELSLPFTLGPFRVVPYAVLDLAGYNNDLLGDSVGRVLGGGGLRASIPFTRLYPEVQSELLNLKGLNHKILFSANFYDVDSNVPYWQLPQLDRLNDDASDQSVRDMKPQDPNLLPGGAGILLATSPLYDPQLLAIRRLVSDRIDTRDSIEVLQLDLRQRLQTKRGYPGMEHIVDWMTLDLSASYFPQQYRDNFGEAWGFLEYDWTWNVGDRTALVSSAWVDPIENGARVFNVGGFYNRNDRTNFYLGYREIDPLQSKAVTSSMTYIFSPKYSMTSIASYDFGIKAEVFTLLFTRVGSDLQASAGISYNSFVNSFNFTFQLVPNAVAATVRNGLTGMGNGLLGR